jgi:hypothetical protein
MLEYQKHVLFNVIVEKHHQLFIKRQRRINALKSPFIKARGVLAGILGENIEEINSEEVIDTSGFDEEKKRTSEIMDSLSYQKYLEYYNDTLKYGLNRTNKVWRKKTG